jgi:hypothetical protein
MGSRSMIVRVPQCHLRAQADPLRDARGLHVMCSAGLGVVCVLLPPGELVAGWVAGCNPFERCPLTIDNISAPAMHREQIIAIQTIPS